MHDFICFTRNVQKLRAKTVDLSTELVPLASSVFSLNMVTTNHAFPIPWENAQVRLIFYSLLNYYNLFLKTDVHVKKTGLTKSPRKHPHVLKPKERSQRKNLGKNTNKHLANRTNN